MESQTRKQVLASGQVANADVVRAQRPADPVTARTREVFMAYSKDHDPRFYSEDAVLTDMTNSGQPFVGREAIGGMLATFYGGAFADGGYTIENLVFEGPRVMLEFKFHGTHTGQFGALAPTGRRVELPVMSVYHVEDGLIRWARLYYDLGSFLRQLGVGE